VAHVAGAGEGPVDQDRDHEEADEREDEEDLKVERAGEDHEEGNGDEPGCEYGRSVTLLRAGQLLPPALDNPAPSPRSRGRDLSGSAAIGNPSCRQERLSGMLHALLVGVGLPDPRRVPVS